jgi:type IV pilus assembly protein PilW
MGLYAMTPLTLLRRQRGLSLIELMIAMVLGLLVAGGIISIFISTSASSRVQTQLARLQEEGRYAITRISGDVAAANGQYCTNTGGNAHLGSGGVYLDGLRAPTVYAAGNSLMAALNDNTTTWGSGTYPSMPAAPYSLPAFLSMRGYDCTTTACTPMDPSTVTFTNPLKGQSQNIGDRVLGSSILTMRYVNPAAGWTIYPTGSATGSTVDVSAADGSLTDIKLNPTANEPPITNIKANDLMMLANCSSAQIFAVSGQGTSTMTPAAVGSTSGSNFAVPSGQAGMAAPVLFDLNTDFQTVTYYLRVVQASDGVTKTGALIRRVNGVDSDPIVTGIERLNFRYGVELPDGTTKFLAAGDVDASTSSTPGCSSQVLNPDTTDKGCLWRAVKSIEVDLVMNGQVPLYTLTNNELQYTYAYDGKTSLTPPGSMGVTPAQQGFANQLIRREFTALVSVRNYNP